MLRRQGLDVLERVRDLGVNAPVIMMSGDWESRKEADALIQGGIRLSAQAVRPTRTRPSRRPRHRVLDPWLSAAQGPRQYGRTGLTYCTVVGCSGWEQSHMQKEAGRGQGYYLRGAR